MLPKHLTRMVPILDLTPGSLTICAFALVRLSLELIGMTTSIKQITDLNGCVCHLCEDSNL
jgi:hypothetical protein